MNRIKPVESLPAALRYVPRHCLQPNHIRGWATTLMVFSQLALAIAFAAWTWQSGPTWLWPLSWLVTGFVLTSIFVLGHDFGHFAIFRQRWLNSTLGHLCFLPALYPFHAWRFAHDAHHKYTNKLNPRHDLYDENTWLLETLEEYTDRSIDVPLPRWLYYLTRVVLPIGSLLYLVKFLYQPSILREAHRAPVYRSYAFLLIGAPALAALIYFATGDTPAESLPGLLHFWVLPTIFLQIWMVSYTYLQHTASDARFFTPEEWTPYRGRMQGTLNVLFPRWISFLHLNIDVHIPHHLAPHIPCYYLREANHALRASPYGSEMRERKLTPLYYYRQWRDCNLWDSARARFASFADARRLRRSRRRSHLPT